MKDSIYYTERYGFMPWTITIAQVLETEHLDWDRKEIAKHLRLAQDEIDRLNDELKKEKNNE